MLGWELPPHNSGGLGVACLQMSKALAIKGASIDFVVPYKAEHKEITHMKIVSATNRPASEHYGAYDSADASIPRGGTNAVSIRDIQREYTKFIETFMIKNAGSYDAIHAHDWLTMEIATRAKQLSGAPLIVHVHATEFDRAGGSYGNPLVHDIEEQGLLAADRIIAVSNLTKQIIVSRYQIPADKIEVLHNAIDLDTMRGHEYDNDTYRYLEVLKSRGYTVIATVTRFTVQKGLHQFMRAAARASERYDKIVFLLAGDGEQRDELLRLSAELGISDKVFFTGFIRGQAWRDAFSVADVFVMSSISEPFGLTALEAAHHGNAVILTRQSGVSEVLTNVYRYDFWDVDALADRMVAIALSEALRDTLKENAAQEYTKITWHDIAERCMQLYGHVKSQTRKALV